MIPYAEGVLSKKALSQGWQIHIWKPHGIHVRVPCSGPGHWCFSQGECGGVCEISGKEQDFWDPLEGQCQSVYPRPWANHSYFGHHTCLLLVFGVRCCFKFKISNECLSKTMTKLLEKEEMSEWKQWKKSWGPSLKSTKKNSNPPWPLSRRLPHQHLPVGQPDQRWVTHMVGQKQCHSFS